MLEYVGPEACRPYVVPFHESRLARAELLTGLLIPKHGVRVAVRRTVAHHAQVGKGTVPLRVNQVMDTSQGIADVRSRYSRRERARIERATRQLNLSLRHETSADAYFEFYDMCYRPTMRSRHGDDARTVARDEAYDSIFRAGVLITARSCGMMLGGSVCRIESTSTTLHARLIGVREGAAELIRQGMQSVIYDAVLSWACEHYLSRVNLQGSEAYLSKGTLQFKARFGSRLELPPAPDPMAGLELTLSADLLHPTVRRFLIDNPIVTARQDTLGSCYYRGLSDPPRLDIPDHWDGLMFREFRELP